MCKWYNERHPTMSLHIRLLIRNSKTISILPVLCIYVWENGAKRVKMSTTKSLLSSIRVSPNAKLILSVSTVICLHMKSNLKQPKTNCYNYDSILFVSSDIRTDAFVCVVTNYGKCFPNKGLWTKPRWQLKQNHDNATFLQLLLTFNLL